MNRRMALALTLLSGGLIPARLLAQDPDDPPPRRRPAPKAAKPNRDRLLDDAPADDPESPAVEESGPPADVRPEPGFTMRTWNIARYTKQAANADNPKPEQKIVEWIFRSFGSTDWYGEKTSILSASRTAIRAYHSPKMLDKVDLVVKRFIDPQAERISIRVRFIRAADTRWRYLVHSRMTLKETGPQGQQVWTLNVADAAQVQSQMQLYRGYEVLLDKTLKIVNGQTLVVEKYEPVDYVAGVQREGAGLGFQPANGQLKEGVTLRLSPLLTRDGDAVDLALDLQTNIVRRLIKTAILTRREVGPNDIQINVPEVSETRLNQPITGWQLGQTLMISAGVTPGILEPKNGFFRVPGTVPTDRELLVVLDAEAVDAPRTARRGEASDDR